MNSRQKASEYFEQVVTLAIAELVEEYRMNGYEAGVHGDKIPFRDKPAIAENHGIWVNLPNGAHKRIAVCWPEGSDKILVSNIRTLGASELYIFDQADKEFLKGRIRGLIET